MAEMMLYSKIPDEWDMLKKEISIMLNLQTIIDAIEMTNDESKAYLDLVTEEIVWFSDYIDSPEEAEVKHEALDDHGFAALPDKNEINEYGMMEDFIETLPEGEQRRTLEIAIDGRGAFRRFKDTVRRYSLEEQWYAFRDNRYMEIACQWCEDNDLEYIHKVPANKMTPEVLNAFLNEDDLEGKIVKINLKDVEEAEAAPNHLVRINIMDLRDE